VLETFNQYQAAEFRVALLLKKYKFGAVSIAKYLGKSRGLIQSWMQIGNKHYLAKEKIQLKRFEKIVKELRRKITKEHMDYFLSKRLIGLDLPVAFISKVLDLPTSTVRSWKNGKIPVEIKKFFYDKKLVEVEYNKLLRFLRSDLTKSNLEYHLAIRLSEEARSQGTRRKIGGRTISQILTTHFGYIEPIPEKTISCWIEKKRKPWNAFKVLTNEFIVQKEFNKILDELTYQHLSYHISMTLAEQYEWKYSKISKVLGINKEQVRGWVKKGRGSLVAKTFVNTSIVEEELKKYLIQDDLPTQNSSVSTKLEKPGSVLEKRLQEIRPRRTITRNKSNKKAKISKTLVTKKGDLDKRAFDPALEQELIYHLETIPTGVTSAKVLKSILIKHKDATIEEIEYVLKNSNQITRNRLSGKWILKQFIIKTQTEPTIEDELAIIDCEKNPDDEVIC
jgi:hypothetical protein